MRTRLETNPVNDHSVGLRSWGAEGAGVRAADLGPRAPVHRLLQAQQEVRQLLLPLLRLDGLALKQPQTAGRGRRAVDTVHGQR